jgi:hypothetical protein
MSERNIHLQKRGRRFNVGPGSWMDRFVRHQGDAGELPPWVRRPKNDVRTGPS